MVASRPACASSDGKCTSSSGLPTDAHAAAKTTTRHATMQRSEKLRRPGWLLRLSREQRGSIAKHRLILVGKYIRFANFQIIDALPAAFGRIPQRTYSMRAADPPRRPCCRYCVPKRCAVGRRGARRRRRRGGGRHCRGRQEEPAEQTDGNPGGEPAGSWMWADQGRDALNGKPIVLR